jgi:hypothetical protein
VPITIGTEYGHKSTSTDSPVNVIVFGKYQSAVTVTVLGAANSRAAVTLPGTMAAVGAGVGELGNVATPFWSVVTVTPPMVTLAPAIGALETTSKTVTVWFANFVTTSAITASD